jgi:retinaldehyde-binding protein 1
MAESEVLSRIGGETLEKARRELREDPDRRAEAVEELRAKIAEAKSDPEYEGVEFSRDDGPFLLRFLRARKFYVDRATLLYCNYYKFRHKYAHLLGDMHPRAVDHVLRSGVMGVTDLRRRDGSVAIQLCPARLDSDTVPFKTMILLLEKLIEDEENQVHGFTIINNELDLSFSTIFKLSQTEQVRKGVFPELLQDSFPGRFKGMHLVNQPWYISLVLGIIRPFMKQKMRDRLFLHGTDYTSMYEHFDPELLPPSLGGSGSEFDVDCLARMFRKELTERPPVSQETDTTVQQESDIPITDTTQ